MSWTLSAFTDEAGGSCDEQIDACQRNKLTHLDLRRVDKFSIVELPVEHAKQVQDKLSAANLAVCMFGSPIGKIDVNDDFEKDVQRLKHLGEMAKVFNTPNVRMFSYFNRTGWDQAKYRHEALDRLKRLRDLADSLGLVLYHENESAIYGDVPERVLEIAELRDGKTFRMIYDFGNYVAEGAPGWETWQSLKPTTDAFHFKDKTRDQVHMPIAEGDGEAERILADAAASGWEGPCVVEPHLHFSDEVKATGPSGEASKKYATMSGQELFDLAIERSQSLLDKLGVQWV